MPANAMNSQPSEDQRLASYVSLVREFWHRPSPPAPRPSESCYARATHNTQSEAADVFAEAVGGDE